MVSCSAKRRPLVDSLSAVVWPIRAPLKVTVLELESDNCTAAAALIRLGLPVNVRNYVLQVRPLHPDPGLSRADF